MTSWDEILARLERWNSSLKGNEQANIQGIILPALRLLGYEVENPEIVYPQETDKDGLRPDFVIYDVAEDGKRQAKFVIEVKAINVPLKNHYDKVLRYMNSGTVRWYFLTNGLNWEVYDRNIPIPLDNCRVATLKLSTLESVKALSHLLNPSLQEPSVNEVVRWMVISEFEKVVDSVPWSTQKMAWDATEHLTTVIRKAIADLEEQYPEQKELIEEQRRRLEDRLRDSPSSQLSYSQTDKSTSNNLQNGMVAALLNAVRWRYALINLILWAYTIDKNKLLDYLQAPKKGSTPRLHVTAYKDSKGNELTKPLPDEAGHFYVHYSADDTQREIKRLVEYFPQLKGQRVTVRQEYLQL